MAKNGKKIRIFSALEVANICGVVNQTAINWIKSGYLKAFMTPGGQYRIYQEDLLEFLKSRGMKIPEELSEGIEETVEWQRILIIDDDRDLNHVLKRYIGRKMPEVTVLQAFDGYEAGRMLSEWKPGVIILDINLPGVDGHKLCRKIKSDPGLGNPVIIGITGLEDPEESEKLMREGADAVYTKPLNMESLVIEIKKLIEKNRDQNERG